MMGLALATVLIPSVPASLPSRSASARPQFNMRFSAGTQAAPPRWSAESRAATPRDAKVGGCALDGLVAALRDRDQRQADHGGQVAPNGPEVTDNLRDKAVIRHSRAHGLPSLPQRVAAQEVMHRGTDILCPPPSSHR